VAPAMNDQQLVVSLAIILIQFNQLSANTWVWGQACGVGQVTIMLSLTFRLGK
jgi:hypothetical protein